MTSARSVIERHQVAINDRNLDAYKDTVTFPFTYQNFNGTAITVETPDQYGDLFPAPWETVIAAFPDWLRTEHESVEELAAGESSAVYKVTARWITRNSKPHKPITAIWIAVKQEGKWGLQFRHNMGTID